MNTKKTDKYVLLGENIRKLRKSRNYSQGLFAKALGISVATLSSYETGKTAPPASTCAKIADMFGISLNQVLNLKEDDSIPQEFSF